MKATFLSRFTPSLMAPEALEAIFVQREREALTRRIVELIRESTLTPSKHHTLLIGPRGIGKTHFIALTYYRIRAMDDLHNHLLITWLREEEWGVTSFLDLLLRIFRALREEHGNAMPVERVESFYKLQPKDAEQTGAVLLKEFVGNRTLLILVENLDDVFAGLGDEGQKRLRAYLQENPFCTILATAQSLFNGIQLQTSPFYGFFRIHHLEELSLEDATHLLMNIANVAGDSDLAAVIAKPLGHARIRAIQHLAGGNHRVYVIFSQFLTRESLDDLVEPFMRMLDDLTPYYQARMAWLSPQQRKIIDFLCDRRGAIPVKEIAQQCFMTHQTTSGQLMDLRDKGYVKSTRIGRASYYELREPLMRLCVEVKKHRGEPIRLFLDFLRLWYSREDLQQRLELLQPDVMLEREYILQGLQAIEEEETEDPRVAACLRDYKAYREKSDYIHALQAAEELVAIRGYASDWVAQGICLDTLGRYDEALASFDKALSLDQRDSHIWHHRGLVLLGLQRLDEALVSFERAIELNPEYIDAWGSRGELLRRYGRLDEALSSFDTIIKLAPNHEMAWHDRGAVLSDLQRFDEAIVSFRKVTELNPKNSVGWNGQGVVLFKLNSLSEALESFEDAIKADPNNTIAWYNRGLGLERLKRYDEALASYDKSIESDKSYASAWFKRETILSTLGRYKEALESCEKAIKLGEKALCVFFNRAELLMELERWDEGCEALNEALRHSAHDDAHIALHTRIIVCDLFTDTRDAAMWQTRIVALIELYDMHQTLAALGQGLVQSIKALNSPMVSDVATRTWRDVWQELTGNRKDFEIPLRLLNAAVCYRETKDERVLLELPVEERTLLEPLLAQQEGSGDQP
jgi:tetratricopeptide (TPR) repeat protein